MPQLGQVGPMRIMILLQRHFSLIVLLALAGCSVHTKVIMPDKTVYEVVSKKDALVEFQQGEISVKVDNRGRPGMIEQALGIMFMNLPSVEIGVND